MSYSFEEQLATTPLFGGSASAVEQFYEQYLEDPQSVPSSWRQYFETLGDPDAEVVHSKIRENLLSEARDGGRAARRARAGSAAVAAANSPATSALSAPKRSRCAWL